MDRIDQLVENLENILFTTTMKRLREEKDLSDEMLSSSSSVLLNLSLDIHAIFAGPDHVDSIRRLATAASSYFRGIARNVEHTLGSNNVILKGGHHAGIVGVGIGPVEMAAHSILETPAWLELMAELKGEGDSGEEE